MYMAVACAREKRPFKIYYLGMTEVISSYEFGGRKFLTAGRQGSALGRPALSRELFFFKFEINQSITTASVFPPPNFACLFPWPQNMRNAPLNQANRYGPIGVAVLGQVAPCVTLDPNVTGRYPNHCIWKRWLGVHDIIW